MAEQELTPAELEWLKTTLLELKRSLGQAKDGAWVDASWQTVRKHLMSRAPGHKVSQEAIRLAGTGKSAGANVLRFVEAGTGAAARVVSTREVVRAERYPGVELAFARARAARVDKLILENVRRFRIGVWKSESGPTEAEVEAMIRAEVEETAALETLYSADDIDAVANKGNRS